MAGVERRLNRQNRDRRGRDTVNLVSHGHEQAKLWASIAPLVEQLQQWHLHSLVANDLK